MKVIDLIKILLEMPMDAQIAIDVDDGMDGNFKPVKGARTLKNYSNEQFVVIDSDFFQNKKNGD